MAGRARGFTEHSLRGSSIFGFLAGVSVVIAELAVSGERRLPLVFCGRYIHNGDLDCDSERYSRNDCQIRASCGENNEFARIYTMSVEDVLYKDILLLLLLILLLQSYTFNSIAPEDPLSIHGESTHLLQSLEAF